MFFLSLEFLSVSCDLMFVLMFFNFIKAFDQYKKK